MKKTYIICLFRKIQGQVVECGQVAHWFRASTKREAERFCNKYNREKGYIDGTEWPGEIDKWAAPVLL
jgi:hypothetical protein